MWGAAPKSFDEQVTHMKRAAFSASLAGLAILILFGLSAADAGAEIVEFDLDEVVNAIKQEIETVRAEESLPPRLVIENIEIYLAVFTREEMNRNTSVKVGGYSGDPTTGSVAGTRQNLSFILVPSGEPETRKYAKRGLVQAIQRVVFDLKNSLNEPPNFELTTFTFNLEFGLQRSTDGGISFDLVNLSPLRSKGLTHRIFVRMVVAD